MESQIEAMVTRWTKMVKLISLTLLLLLSGVALPAQEIIFERYEQGTDFWVIVPYNSIIFKKNTDRVSYQLAIEIRDAKKKLAASFGQTLAIPKRDWLKDTALPVRFSARLEPGKYDATLQLRNLVLGGKTKLKKSFTLGKLTEIGQAYLLVSKDGLTFLPQSLDLAGLDIQTCEIVQSFSVKADSIAIDADESRLVQKSPSSPMRTSLLRDGCLPGKVNVSFYEGNIHYRMDAFMYSPWFSYNLRYNFKDQLQQLRYLANQNEWKSLSALPEKRMSEGIELFWQSRDPSPGTIRNEAREDFYGRVLKADEMFTVHKKLKGWSSDRGRIYIKFGEPDEILFDVLPLGVYPSIVWIYYKENLEFVFSDTGGFGQYKLRNKDAEY